MNSSMDSMLWRATHRFGVFMVGLLLLFAAWEIAHNEELRDAYRVAGASVFGAAGLVAFLKVVRAGKRGRAAHGAQTRQHQRG